MFITEIGTTGGLPVDTKAEGLRNQLQRGGTATGKYHSVVLRSGVKMFQNPERSNVTDYSIIQPNCELMLKYSQQCTMYM